MIIQSIKAKQILDSRRNSTIQVSVNGCKSSSPSGKSTSKSASKLYRKSLKQSIKDINSLNSLVLEVNSFEDLKVLENLIKKKFKLSNVLDFGANSLFALESAVLKALAKSQKKELFETINPKISKSKIKFPIPVGNAIGGGLHSKNKNHPTFQEFLLIPKSSRNSPRLNLKILNQNYKVLKKKTKAKSKNDEGAWQTSLNNEEVLEILKKHAQKTRIGLDIAASSFYCQSEKTYNYKNKSLSKDLQISYINSLIKKYNLFYIEDPIQEKDFSGFSKIKHSSNHLVVGDDLTATHLYLLKKAIKNKSINAIIIKPNQNGSLLNVRDVIDFCKKNKIKTIISHRSGETLDTTIVDLAVAFECDFLKCGISTKYRESKLKRLVEIEKA
jgi:enolase